MGKKINNEEFIKRAKNVHGDKYDYSLVEYISYHIKVKIICSKHGIFEQSPSKHLYQNCPRCVGNVRNTNDEFINMSNIIHKNRYDYSLVKYINAHTKIKIICKEHGIFEQEPRAHLYGYGCPQCSGNKKLTNEIFIHRSIIRHNNIYDYSLVDYKNNSTNVKIICKKHGIFEQLPFNHMKGCGCPKCDNYSAGEKIIEKILKKNNIIYEPQKKI